jgi:predicted ATP-grasp superfamily ATP-dependent carboligase
MSDRPAAFVFKGVPSRFHHGALAVCRTLGRLGVPVHANDEEPGTPTSRSRYRTGSLVWSPWPTSAEEMVERLAAWGRRQDERALLMPVDDAATVVLDEHADTLAEWFRFPRQPEGLARRLSSKWTMAELAREHGLPTARVARVPNLEGLDALLDDFGLPVVIKRIEGWTQDARGVPSVSVARTRERARALLAEQPENLLLQEYIPGGSATSWMFNGYFDGEGRCLFGATGYKIRQYPLSGGFTTLGQLEPHDELEASIRSFLEGVGYRGIVDLGLRLDVRDGQYKLLDVNPRVGSTFRLFVDSADDDVVRVAYADLVDGRSEPRTARVERRRWVAEPHDFRAGAALVRSGSLTASSFVRSTLSADERAWWARDDPRPFAAALFSDVRATAGLAAAGLRARA